MVWRCWAIFIVINIKITNDSYMFILFYFLDNIKKLMEKDLMRKEDNNIWLPILDNLCNTSTQSLWLADSARTPQIVWAIALQKKDFITKKQRFLWTVTIYTCSRNFQSPEKMPIFNVSIMTGRNRGHWGYKEWNQRPAFRSSSQ